MTNKTNCVICGSKEAFLAEENILEPVSMGVFSVYVCSSCTVGYTHPVPNNLEGYYDQES